MQRLIEGARALNLHLTEQQLLSFQVYYEELVLWNHQFNLTAITGYEQIQIRHFLDSLSCLLAEETRQTLNRPRARFIDVGSGAGFPGIPLKLVCPAMRLTLLEATGKKVEFLEHVVSRLGLRGVLPVNARAEELAHEAAHREQYDLALVRAVAEVAVVVEYALPFCKVGGWVIAQKGEAGAGRGMGRPTRHQPTRWRTAPRLTHRTGRPARGSFLGDRQKGGSDTEPVSPPSGYAQEAPPGT